MSTEKLQPVRNIKEKDEALKELILYNDEVNTFDFVIETLMDVCEHDQTQAEQCAMIAHYKGKCPVKSGTFADLKPLKEEMTRRKLTVSIK
jgi:ATP-dependent Clp protease adaptor protein ClpS